jgi:RHS repeat-associated protein
MTLVEHLACGPFSRFLYHFGARYYDPSTATCTQQDPINQIASLTEANRYSYVGGNPADGSDSNGLATANGGLY